MATAGKGSLETIRRGFRTALFMVTMVASLLVLSAPLLVALGDVSVSLALASTFACVRCHGFRGHLDGYSFRSSLMDIPLVSVVRSLIITCSAIISSITSIFSPLICHLFFIPLNYCVLRDRTFVLPILLSSFCLRHFSIAYVV